MCRQFVTAAVMNGVAVCGSLDWSPANSVKSDERGTGQGYTVGKFCSLCFLASWDKLHSKDQTEWIGHRWNATNAASCKLAGSYPLCTPCMQLGQRRTSQNSGRRQKNLGPMCKRSELKQNSLISVATLNNLFCGRFFRGPLITVNLSSGQKCAILLSFLRMKLSIRTSQLTH